MLKLVDQLVASSLLLVGGAHIAVASRVFGEPTEARIWFLSAGLMGLVTGLANLARARSARPERLASLTALVGALAIVLTGVLLGLAGTAAATRAPALAVFAIGGLAAAFSLRDLLRR